MLALRKATPDATSLSLEEVPVPEPGPGQARIAVTAAGMCGTDLHILAGDYASRPPVTLGHEIAGRVDALGEGVDPGWLGALVAPETAFSTCGRCDWCRTARPMLCRERLSVGSGVDGGFAAAVVVPATKLHRLPDWLDDHAAALLEPLACGCNSLFDPAVVEAGDTVVVTGPGPVGLLAAQLARVAGGQVIVVGTAGDRERLAVAQRLAFDTRDVDEPADRASLDQAGLDRRIDVVVEASGAPAAVRSALTWLRPRGTLVQMGLLSGEISVPFGEIVTRELRVRAGFGSSPASWLRAVRLVRERQVELEPLLSEVLPLRDWPKALDAFEHRDGLKTVFDPRLD
ncbi:MAG TPA: alcohol dehydrogenase catalytic domain-containing protein [Candidatus Saccharimonadales bacterium]|nr:alcohol dehydrogenase catalytic domain-containing protein [Candidatus Saccharimonadales bacterium]